MIRFSLSISFFVSFRLPMFVSASSSSMLFGRQAFIRQRTIPFIYITDLGLLFFSQRHLPDLVYLYGRLWFRGKSYFTFFLFIPSCNLCFRPRKYGKDLFMEGTIKKRREIDYPLLTSLLLYYCFVTKNGSLLGVLFPLRMNVQLRNPLHLTVHPAPSKGPTDSSSTSSKKNDRAKIVLEQQSHVLSATLLWIFSLVFKWKRKREREKKKQAKQNKLHSRWRKMCNAFS